jgi:hypothetical protein
MGKHHYRCNACGRDFDAHDQLKHHLERRHPEQEAHWWVAVEDPSVLPFE